MHRKSSRRINTIRILYLSGPEPEKMYVTLKTDDMFSLKTIHRFVKEVPKTFPEALILAVICVNCSKSFKMLSKVLPFYHSIEISDSFTHKRPTYFL